MPFALIFYAITFIYIRIKISHCNETLHFLRMKSFFILKHTPVIFVVITTLKHYFIAEHFLISNGTKTVDTVALSILKTHINDRQTRSERHNKKECGL